MISVSDSENGKGVSERGGVNMYTFFLCRDDGYDQFNDSNKNK